jgi:hypothetical protein
VYLVFSEDSRAVMPLLADAQARIPDLQFMMVEEDFATSLAVMTLCQHHIVADSSFSFWGKCDLIYPVHLSHASQEHISTRNNRVAAKSWYLRLG